MCQPFTFTTEMLHFSLLFKIIYYFRENGSIFFCFFSFFWFQYTGNFSTFAAK